MFTRDFFSNKEQWELSLNSILFPNKHVYMSTHIDTNAWLHGLENKLLKT